MNDQKNSTEVNPASLAAITLFKRPIFLKPLQNMIYVCVYSHFYCLLPSVLSAKCPQPSPCFILVICCCFYRCASRCVNVGSCQRGGLCRTELRSQSYIQRSHHPKPLSSACGGVGAPRLQRSHPHQIWSVCSSCSSKLQG